MNACPNLIPIMSRDLTYVAGELSCGGVYNGMVMRCAQCSEYACLEYDMDSDS